MDRVVAQRVRRACCGHAPSLRAIRQLERGGWTYTGTLATFIDILSKDQLDAAFVEVPSYDPSHEAHAVLSVFLFGKGSQLRDLDPQGGLFERPATMYQRLRVDGKGALRVHPSLHRYVSSRVDQGRLHSGGGGGGQASAECVVGTGKDGSAVFAVEDACIEEFVAGKNYFCTHGYSSNDDGKSCGSATWLKQNSVMKDTLLKVNSDPKDTADELYANAKVHKWLSTRYFLHLTSLHPSIHMVTAKKSENDKAVTHIVALRRLRGDVKGVPNSTADVVQIAKTVLIVLHIIHANGYLHMDIKPHNILYSTIGGKKKHFAVADFGLMESMSTAYRHLKTGGWSGTPGYISPLLLQSADNDVYHHFVDVARRSRGIVYSTNELANIFREQRDILRADRGMAKLDLHSLGLALWRLVDHEAHHEDALYAPLLDFIYRLLFFRADSFVNTFQALQALCAMSASLCDDINIIPNP